MPDPEVSLNFTISPRIKGGQAPQVQKGGIPGSSS